MDERWEYWTCLINANREKAGVQEMIRKLGMSNVAKFAPVTMIPELNEFGKKGWELVQMEPVPAGQNDDIAFGDHPKSWSNWYFCVFKRRLSA